MAIAQDGEQLPVTSAGIPFWQRNNVVVPEWPAPYASPDAPSAPEKNPRKWRRLAGPVAVGVLLGGFSGLGLFELTDGFGTNHSHRTGQTYLPPAETFPPSPDFDAAMSARVELVTADDPQERLNQLFNNFDVWQNQGDEDALANFVNQDDGPLTQSLRARRAYTVSTRERGVVHFSTKFTPTLAGNPVDLGGDRQELSYHMVDSEGGNPYRFDGFVRVVKMQAIDESGQQVDVWRVYDMEQTTISDPPPPNGLLSD